MRRLFGFGAVTLIVLAGCTGSVAVAQAPTDDGSVAAQAQIDALGYAIFSSHMGDTSTTMGNAEPGAWRSLSTIEGRWLMDNPPAACYGAIFTEWTQAVTDYHAIGLVIAISHNATATSVVDALTKDSQAMFDDIVARMQADPCQ